ncbi:helicase associated domain-containing protein [bacterium]|nr:helicase associated domain-containing protein [bacterium]
MKKRKKLSADRVKRLDDLGFFWNKHEGTWKVQLQKLEAYKEEHGDCLVPRSFEDSQLAAWIQNQRTLKKRKKLSADRVKRLDDLGFVWNKGEGIWEMQFQKLVAYKEKHGDCLVPQTWQEDRKLATWVANQRARKERLEKEKIKRLDGLGFVWETLQEAWEVQFQKLEAYKEQYGDCLVPSTSQYAHLVTWIGTQRTRKDKLGIEKIKRLDELGFVWDPHEEKWELQFQRLKAYKEEYGDCLVPRSFEDKKLAAWAKNQRTLKRTRKLSADRIGRLDDLGFVWRQLEGVWEGQFQKLVAYKEKHGDCLVPNKWQEDSKLGNWVGTQRTLKRSGKIGADRIKRLDEIGFVWDATK